jgi:hypothetical protein
MSNLSHMVRWCIRLPLDVYKKINDDAEENLRSVPLQVKKIICDHYREKPDVEPVEVLEDGEEEVPL